MKIVIVGARQNGQAKVVLEIVEAMETYEVAGFIDDDPEKVGQSIRGYPVLGGMADLSSIITSLGIQGGIVAISHCEGRYQLGIRLKEHGLSLISAIHPTSHLDSDVRLGAGVVIGPKATIVTGSVIGDSVNILTSATIDHDNRIGDGVVISPGVHTSGRVVIEDYVFVGTGAVFLPDARVGRSAVIGGGAVVLRSVPSGETWVGVPAKPIRST